MKGSILVIGINNEQYVMLNIVTYRINCRAGVGGREGEPAKVAHANSSGERAAPDGRGEASGRALREHLTRNIFFIKHAVLLQSFAKSKS